MDLRIHAFVDCYRQTFNATKAAEVAGYAPSGAEAIGSRLLRDDRVQALLARYALDVQAATNVRVGDVLQALCEIAYLDPAALFEQRIDPATGIVTLRLLELTEMPVHVRRCIMSFKVVKKNLIAGDGKIDTLFEVKFWPKTKALELLAQHKALLNPKLDEAVTVKQLERMSDDELAATVEEGRQRWERHVEARKQSRLALAPKTRTA